MAQLLLPSVVRRLDAEGSDDLTIPLLPYAGDPVISPHEQVEPLHPNETELVPRTRQPCRAVELGAVLQQDS